MYALQIEALQTLQILTIVQYGHRDANCSSSKICDPVEKKESIEIMEIMLFLVTLKFPMFLETLKVLLLVTLEFVALQFSSEHWNFERRPYFDINCNI